LGLDALVIVLATKLGELFWIVPPLVTSASLLGAALTYWIGQTAGYAGLPRLIPGHQLDRMKARLDATGAGALAIAALMPPPFPLTAFLLTCGALEFDRRRFVVVFGLMRMIRYGTVALLVRHFGDGVLHMLQTEGVQAAVTTSIWITVMAAVAFGAVLWFRTRPQTA
jgi:membrane protein YqaA with SNARE-associated domain